MAIEDHNAFLAMTSLAQDSGGNRISQCGWHLRKAIVPLEAAAATDHCRIWVSLVASPPAH